jgi:tetratricopeptide (TPR) repeat protein
VRGPLAIAAVMMANLRSESKGRSEPFQRGLTEMDEYFDLGSHSFPVTTTVPSAQVWFDRGMNWLFGFNHREAVTCFEHAVAEDPDCPMAYWGIAMAAGPNYNKQWERFDERELKVTARRTFNESQNALSLRGKASPKERAIIETLRLRYPSPESAEDFQKLYDDYAESMRTVYQQFPDDMDVTTLFADALMCRTPWQLWDLETGVPNPEASTLEAREVLERALSTPSGREHPGVLHLYIHLMEMSPTPEKALKAGDWLRGLVPDAGHLEHMPTHIDVLCGDYERVVASNQDAIVADRKYVAQHGAENYYTLYRVHNYHFKIYGAMFLGQCEAAMDTYEEMVSTIPEALLRWESPPMADWLEPFFPIKWHILIRFGRWQEIIDSQIPEDRELYCVTVATAHYAKAIAHAASGHIPEAEEHKRLFQEAVGWVPDTRYLHNNCYLDILQIADAMLNGEVEYRKGNIEAAFEHLRRAVRMEDGLEYDEPWSWMQPTRHALGALLLEQDRVEEATQVYREDLGYDPAIGRAYWHPDNVWALHGYHECLTRLGRMDEAAIIRQRLTLAEARTDIPVQASCACRTSVVGV